MKHVCVLLNGSIINDSRVIKTIKTISKIAEVDLFYVNATDADKSIFEHNVLLFNCKQVRSNLTLKIVKHSCFYNEFLFYVDEVLKQKKKYDYIFCNDLPTLKPGYLLKLKLGSKLIYDSHEIFTGTINQFFPDNATFFKSLVFKSLIWFMTSMGNRAEKKLVKKADYFITTSQSFKSYFSKKFNRDDIKIVMNCPSTQEVLRAYDFRKHFDLKENDFVVLFQGVLNKGRALFELVEAMKYTSANIKLVFLGDGMLKPLLQNKVNNTNMQHKIFFMDRVPSKDLIFYTKGADAGINLQAPINISKKLASANKLFEYMHANIPIIASDVPENKLVVEKYNLGYIVENKPTSIANAINKMAISDRSVYIENCKKAATEYNWENQEKCLLSIFE
ncbi:MAG: glycosyltransferase [Salinivirgaceae bacterium]|nr:glycosyltransferase [Salinivirgaceae bacterium]